jgi:hypothetical protein
MPSRLDAEKAVRMAVTGHSREQVAKAIFDGASASRPREDRDWEAYARRAVQRAFGAPGEQARARLELLRDKLLRLEGRQDERQLLRGLWSGEGTVIRCRRHETAEVDPGRVLTPEHVGHVDPEGLGQELHGSEGDVHRPFLDLLGVPATNIVSC